MMYKHEVVVLKCFPRRFFFLLALSLSLAARLMKYITGHLKKKKTVVIFGVVWCSRIWGGGSGTVYSRQERAVAHRKGVAATPQTVFLQGDYSRTHLFLLILSRLYYFPTLPDQQQQQQLAKGNLNITVSFHAMLNLQLLIEPSLTAKKEHFFTHNLFSSKEGERKKNAKGMNFSQLATPYPTSLTQHIYIQLEEKKGRIIN